MPSSWISVDIVEVVAPATACVMLSIESRRRIMRPPSDPWFCRDVDVQALVSSVEASASASVESGDSWEGVRRQFDIDFPRYFMYMNGKRCTDADETVQSMRAATGDEAVVRQLVALSTQGALADVYFRVADQLVKDPHTHVVDGGGSYRIHITAHEGLVRIRVTKCLTLARIDPGDDTHRTLATLRVSLRLQLAPSAFGSETLQIRAADRQARVEREPGSPGGGPAAAAATPGEK